jgi:hypothetical protein
MIRVQKAPADEVKALEMIFVRWVQEILQYCLLFISKKLSCFSKACVK